MNYSCKLVDPGPPEKPFGSGNAPDSVVTAVIQVQDIVGVDGTFPIKVKLNPGPANGPIKLDPGNLTYKVQVLLSGATAQSLTMSGGPNTVVVPPNALPVVPDVGTLDGEIRAAAPVDGKVLVSLGQVDLIGFVGGLTVDTRCVPSPKEGQSAADVASVTVVAGTVDNSNIPPASAPSATAPAASKSGTYASCAEAKAAGRGVIPRSSPAYSVNLDADKDGLACEANEGSSSTSTKVLAATTSTTSKALALTGQASFRAALAGLAMLAGGLLILGTVGWVRRRSIAR